MSRSTSPLRSAGTRLAGSVLLLLASALPLAAGANRFTPIGGPEGGAVRMLAGGKGGRVWATTEVSGLFHSTDGALGWEQVVGTVPGAASSGQAIDPSWSEGPISAIAIDPGNPDILFAGAGDHLFRTRDGGATWTPVGLGGPTSFVQIAPSNPSIVYVVGGAGLARSRNGGDSWQSVTAARPIGITALAIDPHDANVLYAGTYGRLWRSPDGGVHWRPLVGLGALGGRTVTRLAVDPDSPRLYAGTDDGLFLSADGGASWSLAASGPTRGAGRIDAVALDPYLPTTLYVAVHRESFNGEPDDGAVFKSRDGGITWTWLYQLPKVAQALAADPGTPFVIYAGTNRDGVYVSADGGTTWTLSVHGLAATFVTSLTADPLVPDTLYAAAQATATNISNRSLGAFRSVDRGATWRPINNGLTGDPRPNVVKIVADPKTAGTLYAPTFEHGLFKSIDSGASWQAIENGLPMDAVRDLAVDPVDPRNLYAVGFQRLPSPQILRNAAARSTDGGASWTAMGGTLTDQYLQAVAVDPTQPSRLYAGELLAFGSSDSGQGWLRLPSPNGNTIGQLVVSPADGSVYAVTTNNGFYKSLDHGTSWLPFNNFGYTGQASPFEMALDPADPSVVYITSYRGVLAATSDGEWAPLDPAITKPMAAIAVEPKAIGTIYVSQRQGGRLLAYTPAPSDCVSDATTVCLLGRFAARATFDYLPNGTLFVPGRALTAQAAGFQLALPGRTDLLAKIVDGRSANGNYWLFFNSFQTFYTLRVTDTRNGRFRFYARWRGNPVGAADLAAFPDGSPAPATVREARAAAAAPLAASAPAARSCVPGPTTLCLFRNRFRVEMMWSEPGGPQTPAQALPLQEANFGGFTFFGPDDLQIGVRIEDHRHDFGHWWIEASALTNLDYDLTFTDTVTGRQKTYTNRNGKYADIFDTQAF